MTHQKRPWIKVQLSTKVQSQEAAALVKDWKAQRQAANQIVRAVRLYGALCQGDASLLEEYFPGMNLGISIPAARRPVLAAPTITFVARSEAEELEDALDGLGLESLDFGQ